jgi:hypothetical protein
VVTIQVASTQHPKESWWLSAQRVHTLGGTFLRVGRKRDRWRTFFISSPFELWFIFSISFLYALYIAVNANFKLKGKERHLKDVELMPGWGAYMPETEYQTHIANSVDQPEVCELFYFVNRTHVLSQGLDRSIHASRSTTH